MFSESGDYAACARKAVTLQFPVPLFVARMDVTVPPMMKKSSMSMEEPPLISKVVGSSTVIIAILTVVIPPSGRKAAPAGARMVSESIGSWIDRDLLVGKLKVGESSLSVVMEKVRDVAIRCS